MKRATVYWHGDGDSRWLMARGYFIFCLEYSVSSDPFVTGLFCRDATLLVRMTAARFCALLPESQAMALAGGLDLEVRYRMASCPNVPRGILETLALDDVKLVKHAAWESLGLSWLDRLAREARRLLGLWWRKGRGIWRGL